MTMTPTAPAPPSRNVRRFICPSRFLAWLPRPIITLRSGVRKDSTTGRRRCRRGPVFVSVVSNAATGSSPEFVPPDRCHAVLLSHSFDGAQFFLHGSRRRRHYDPLNRRNRGTTKFTLGDIAGESLSRETSRAVVSEGGLEPPRPCGHQLLRLARLPIPPLRRGHRRPAGRQLRNANLLSQLTTSPTQDRHPNQANRFGLRITALRVSLRREQPAQHQRAAGQ